MSSSPTERSSVSSRTSEPLAVADDTEVLGVELDRYGLRKPAAFDVDLNARDYDLAGL